MADQNGSNSTPTGFYTSHSKRQTSRAEWVGFFLALIWLAFSILFVVFEQQGILQNLLKTLVTILVVFIPIALLWVAVIIMRTARHIEQESHKLQIAIDALRKTYLEKTNAMGDPMDEATLARKLDQIALSTRKAEQTLAIFTSTRVAQSRPAELPVTHKNQEPHQTTLALGTQIEEVSPPLSREDFIRALNFPQTAQDDEGFASLRRAYRDRQAAQIIQAAQDILTLLSQEGIYMDDMRPDLARPEIWRTFAKGERGRTISALGGIRDRSSLALTSQRMKNDPIFRDTAHHFLRLFDKSFAKFESDATDQEITALSETRTARAFMLIGRIAGTFD